MKIQYKIVISFLVILFFNTGLINASNSFVLITLNENESFSYQNIKTGEISYYNIIEQDVYGTDTNAIYINVLSTDRNDILYTIPQQINNSDVAILLSEAYNYQFNNSAKGNFLIKGIENRNLTFTLLDSGYSYFFDENVTVNYSFTNADRALTVLTGNPIIDTFTINLQAHTGRYLNPFDYGYNYNSTIEEQVVLYIRYQVQYLPSSSFVMEYKGQTINCVNITEKFYQGYLSFFINNEHVNKNLEENAFTYVIRKDLDGFQNTFTFAEDIGLPVQIISEEIQSDLLFLPINNTITKNDLLSFKESFLNSKNVVNNKNEYNLLETSWFDLNLSQNQNEHVSWNSLFVSFFVLIFLVYKKKAKN